tara:strand:+ start:6301 stop:8658 length:2358 start_codon:yes stop_codon:yes gene_type:complete
MPCASIPTCVRELMPYLIFVQGVCPDETRSAFNMVRANAAWLPTFCTNGTLQAGLDEAFDRGTFRDLMTCAVRFGGFRPEHLGHASMSALRNFLCGPPGDARGLPDDTLRRSAIVGSPAALACAFVAACVAAAAVAWCRKRPTVCGNVLALVLILLPCLLASSATTAPAAAFSMNDFYYRDAVTACHYEIERRVPDATLEDRTLSVVSPAASARSVYATVRELDVNGTSLTRLCGHCDLRGDAAVMTHLVLNASSAPLATDAVFTLLLPAFASRTWRRELARALVAALAGTQAAFSSREQAEADVVASTRVAPAIVGSSALFTFSTLLASVASFYDGRMRHVPAAFVLCVIVFGVVFAAIVVGDAARAALGVPRSPYAIVVVPVCLGTGVDSVLILLTAYRRSGRFDHAWPSLVGSGLTSTCSFAIAMCIRVGHLRSLFTVCIVTFLANTALNVVAFPAAVRALYPQALIARAATTKEPRGRLWWKPALVILLLFWAGLLPFLRAVRTSADLSYTIAEGSMTRRFLDRTRTAPRPSVMYALVRDGANWTDVEARIASAGATPVVDWHRAFVESREPSVVDWLRRAPTQLLYGPFFGEGSSVVIATASAYATADNDVEALTRLHAHAGPGMCFAQFDRMAGYTVATITQHLWILAVAAAACSAVVAVGIAGRHGAAVLPALALSYATMTAVLGAVRVPAHMLLVAAYAVSPGFLVDFQIHLAYNPDNRMAVLMSAATSVASMAPYVATELPGVRDFAVCYIGFLTVGVLCAFLSTVTRAVNSWEAL